MNILIVRTNVHRNVCQTTVNNKVFKKSILQVIQ